MTEWEQIKKEYREVPIPANGPHQMLEVIAEAKRKRGRERWKHMAKYGSVVAAAILVIVILPGILFFSQGFGGSNDMATTESAVCEEESTGSDDWFTRDSAESVMEDRNMASTSDTEYSSTPNAGGSSGNDGADSLAGIADSDDFDYGISNKVAGSESGTDFMPTPAAGQISPEQSTSNTELNEEEKKEELILPLTAISAEILRQMKVRMKETDETYYMKSETCPDGFEKITEEQDYYINEEGLYVIIFEAGEVAPKEQGNVEFVIPAEVAQP